MAMGSAKMLWSSDYLSDGGREGANRGACGCPPDGLLQVQTAGVVAARIRVSGRLPKGDEESKLSSWPTVTKAPGNSRLPGGYRVGRWRVGEEGSGVVSLGGKRGLWGSEPATE